MTYKDNNKPMQKSVYEKIHSYNITHPVWIDGELKENYPDCAVTLSLGEKGKESYQKYFDAGANRYLLRHETANAEHYAKLHPKELSFSNRMRCLRELKEIGFQTGCGFMVGYRSRQRRIWQMS